MDAPTTTTTTPFPSIYTKFNSALNAGLLNPMSPPPPSRSSPTLFEMMANEPQPTPNPNPPSQTLTPHHRHLLLQDRVHQILSSCPLPLAPADVKLTLTSKDGVSVVAGVHREVLVGKSRFFAARLGRGRGSVVEISECEDVEIYVEAVRLMYCGEDVRRWMVGEEVGKVLAILKVCAAIGFDAGVLSCLEYLEAAPWAEEEEDKVAALLSELRLDGSGTVEVLKRVSMEVGEGSESTNSKGSEEILLRLLQVVLEGKDEKARREMKGLVSKMLRENNNKSNAGNVLSKESLYSACDSCLDLLHRSFVRSATSDLEEVGQIARQADNLHWLLDILIDRQIADDFLRTWAAQTELAEIHPKVPAIHRYEVSRVTSRLFVGIGKGQILVSKETRCSLLKTWLEPFYEDFGWMRRACKGLDRHLIEDGLGNTILTLPLGLQQEILLVWFDRFLNSGDDCPNLQRGFEVWWRRAFWRRHSEPEQTQELRLATTSNGT